MKINLDKPGTYSAGDPSHMGDRITNLSYQYQLAWDKGWSFDPPPNFSKVKKVFLIGMGGSAIAADLVKGLIGFESMMSLTVVRGYTPPSLLDSRTLLIMSSYSGDTEETIAAYAEVRKLGLPTLVITGGGRLLKEAIGHGTPVIKIDYEGEPRSALGYSFGILLALLGKLGLIDNKEAQLDVAVKISQGMTSTLLPEVPKERNLAKVIATEMYGRLPIVYGAEFLEPVARRWKTQLNENGKMWAFYESLPELNHNAIAGYSFPDKVRELAYVVSLYSRHLHPRTRLRYQLTEELLIKQGVSHRQVEGLGEDPLSQVLTSVLLGDFVSYYLGILNQADPSLVLPINHLKNRMEEI